MNEHLKKTWRILLFLLVVLLLPNVAASVQKPLVSAAGWTETTRGGGTNPRGVGTR